MIMATFIPYEKLSKKKQRELSLKKRNTWGEINPITRKTEDKKKYNRKKAQQSRNEFYSVEPYFYVGSTPIFLKKS